jgi:hypothetical protein
VAVELVYRQPDQFNTQFFELVSAVLECDEPGGARRCG